MEATRRRASRRDGSRSPSGRRRGAGEAAYSRTGAGSIDTPEKIEEAPVERRRPLREERAERDDAFVGACAPFTERHAGGFEIASAFAADAEPEKQPSAPER